MAHLRQPNEKIRICTAPRLPSRYVPKRTRAVEQSAQDKAEEELNDFLRLALRQLIETRPSNPVKFLAYELFKAGGVSLPPGSDEYNQYHAAKRIQQGLRGRYARRRVRRLTSEKKRLVNGVEYGGEHSDAAMKMQSVRRGKQSRRRVTRIAREQKRMDNGGWQYDEYGEHAATIIQATDFTLHCVYLFRVHMQCTDRQPSIVGTVVGRLPHPGNTGSDEGVWQARKRGQNGRRKADKKKEGDKF